MTRDWVKKHAGEEDHEHVYRIFRPETPNNVEDIDAQVVVAKTKQTGIGANFGHRSDMH